MKKFLVSLVIVVGLAIFVVSQRRNTLIPSTNNQQIQFGSATPTPSTTVSQTTIDSPGQTPPPLTNTPTPKPAGAYKDGVYRGSVADAYYGNVQVAVSIQNGRISDVQFLQYPNSGGHTSEVSNVALPILRSEAIQSQNAHVNIVSGATDTSSAFIQSLTVALNQAK